MSRIVAVAAAALWTGTTVFVAAQTRDRFEPIDPIAPAVVRDAAMVELGKKLYFDPRLSKSGFISCNSCHNLSMGGSDNLTSSIGDNWQKGPINSPTVLNSSMSVAQFWDGRAPTLKAQAGGPIANPKEMAFTHELAVEVISSIPQYVDDFSRVFNSPQVDIERITTAIAAFEETLVTPNARFDKWLKGDAAALNAEERAGYALLSKAAARCVTTGRRRAARRSARWVLSSLTARITRQKADTRSPGVTPTGSISRCRRCATWS